MIFRICLFLALVCCLGCTRSEETFIPENPEPPPTQEEGTLNRPADAPAKKPAN
jgi:hypothetical protein